MENNLFVTLSAGLLISLGCGCLSCKREMLFKTEYDVSVHGETVDSFIVLTQSECIIRCAMKSHCDSVHLQPDERGTHFICDLFSVSAVIKPVDGQHFTGQIYLYRGESPIILFRSFVDYFHRSFLNVGK